MQGIVSLLDEPHYRLTEALWKELEDQFGLTGVYNTPYPHFSYHVAQGYDQHRLGFALQKVVDEVSPIQIETSGLGIFSGQMPVLYIAVVRTSALTQLHRFICEAVADCAEEPQSHYEPEHWLPHVTLAIGDLTPEITGKVVQFLSQRDFMWRLYVNNLAYISEDNREQTLKLQYPIEDKKKPETAA